MNRQQLEHLIRASGTISEEKHVIVVGSQSILGAVPNAGEDFTQSPEADVFLPNAPEKTDDLNVIGERSPFHDTHGYYADPVDENTAKLPEGWKDRLVEVNNANTNGVTGWCLDTNDLAVSKLMAFRDKDREFVKAMIDHKLADPQVIEKRIPTVKVSQEVKDHAQAWLGRNTIADNLKNVVQEIKDPESSKSANEIIARSEKLDLSSNEEHRTTDSGGRDNINSDPEKDFER